MNKVAHYFLAVSLALITACSKDDPAPALPSAPEALAEHDAKSGGLYRGVIATANNSGSFTINLQNGKKEVTMRVNNITKTLVTNDLDNWTSGEDMVAGFSNGNWAVQVEINANGTSINMVFSIGGVTNFNGAIAKELSTSQVKVYEGTFTGDDSGKWNFIWQGDQVNGVYYTATDDDNFTGAVTGNDINITSNNLYVTAIGTFTTDGSSASGTWNGTPVSTDGTWTGTRTF